MEWWEDPNGVYKSRVCVSLVCFACRCGQHARPAPAGLDALAEGTAQEGPPGQQSMQSLSTAWQNLEMVLCSMA